MYQWIFMPVNVGGNHWVLLVANTQDQTVGILDSLNPNGCDEDLLGKWR